MGIFPTGKAPEELLGAIRGFFDSRIAMPLQSAVRNFLENIAVAAVLFRCASLS